MTPLQRWRKRRDAVIYHAWRGGFSQRCLADVFDLPRSRIATIAARVGTAVGSDRGAEGGGTTPDSDYAPVRNPEVAGRPGTRVK